MAVPVATEPPQIFRLGGFTVDREIVRYIKEASDQSGISFDYLLAKAGHESRFEVNAAAQRSSAEGLFQFTSETWLQLMKVHGAKYGYAKLVQQIYRDGRGRYRVKTPQAKEELLNLRRSPRISALIAAEFAKSNKKILEDQIGIKVTSADLYLAHFMGPNGAVMLIRADKFTPHKYAADLFPEAALANPPIFYNEKKKMRTVRQVRKYIADMFQEKIERFAILPSSLKTWLQKNEIKMRKSSVVVEAPILKIESTENAPVPKVVDSLTSARILPGEGVNLDDDSLLNDYRLANLTYTAQSGTSDTVSADFIPQVQKSYDISGINSIENDVQKKQEIAYTLQPISFFESDDYLINGPLPVMMTVSE